eukprot:11375148-Karenia_brevis.AAC.1
MPLNHLRYALLREIVENSMEDELLKLAWKAWKVQRKFNISEQYNANEQAIVETSPQPWKMVPMRKRRRRRQQNKKLESNRFEARQSTTQYNNCIETHMNLPKIDDTLPLKILNWLEHGQANLPFILVSGRVWEFSTNQYGCRAIQNSMLATCAPQQAALINELRGHVLEACFCHHANFVLQRAIEVAPYLQIDFVAKEIQGQTMKVACHQMGCRVMQRLLEHGGSMESMQPLIHEMYLNATELCQSKFGHYVAQSILEHCCDRVRSLFTNIFCAHSTTATTDFSSHKYGRFVMQAALTYCSPKDTRRISEAITSRALSLAIHLHGSYVLITAISRGQNACEARERTLYELAGYIQEIQRSKYGRRVMKTLQK